MISGLKPIRPFFSVGRLLNSIFGCASEITDPYWRFHQPKSMEKSPEKPSMSKTGGTKSPSIHLILSSFPKGCLSPLVTSRGKMEGLCQVKARAFA